MDVTLQYKGDVIMEISYEPPALLTSEIDIKWSQNAFNLVYEDLEVPIVYAQVRKFPG